MSSRIECPYCGRTVEPSGVAGVKVRCPRCQAVFPTGQPKRTRPMRVVEPEPADVVAAEEEADGDAIQTTRSRPSAPQRKQRRDSEDEPIRRPRPRGGFPVLLLIGGIFAGFALLVACGGGAVLWWMFRSSPPAVVVGGDARDPAPNVAEGPARGFAPPRPEPPAPMAWRLQPDPGAPIRLARAPEKGIPVKIWGTDLIYPSTPSPFVAVGTNIVADDAREIWDLRTMRQTGRLAGQLHLGEPLALSPDGAYLAGVVPTQLNRVDVWQVATGKSISIDLNDKQGFTDLVDFVGPNELLIGYPVGGGKVFRVWDLTTGRQLRSVSGPSFWERDSAALSPGRKYLAVANSDKVFAYDLRAAAPLGELVLPKANRPELLMCRGMGFSPDGVELAGLFTAGADTRLISWDVATGRVVADHRFQGDIKSTLKNTALYRGRALDWKADRSGWLLYGKAVVDHKTGQVVATVRENENDPMPGPRRVLGSDHVALVVGELGARSLIVVPLPRN